jgi:chromosome segregation and condensation protein ScpB
MNPQALVEAIVQQTTVLIAQVSTSAGIRAPLAGVADQVFLSLAREIEAQGVGRKVVADMFGLAIRTYQKKVQRLAESQTMRSETLWEALLAYMRVHGPIPRGKLFEAFRKDPEREVGAVLNDLVTTGLVYASGRGDATIYGVTSEADRRAIDDASADALSMRLWAHVFDHPGVTRDELRAVSRDADAMDRAIDQLLAEGRIKARPPVTGSATPFYAEKLVIPIGQELGWEAAFIQHFRAVTNALAAKVKGAAGRSSESDLIGGATYTFGVHEGHPHSEKVHGLLRSVREEVQRLFREVSEYNDAHPEYDGKRSRVTFYFGQNVLDRDDLDAAAENEC